MFDTILVPLDGSQLADCVLPHVLAIARSFEAEITLLHMLEKIMQVHQRNCLIYSTGKSIKHGQPFIWKRQRCVFRNRRFGCGR